MSILNDILTLHKQDEKVIGFVEQEGKLKFIYFKMQGCGWCEKMERETFRDPVVRTRLLNFDVQILEREKSVAMLKKYIPNARGFPCYCIVDSQDKVVRSESGYMGVKEFVNWLKVPLNITPF